MAEKGPLLFSLYFGNQVRAAQKVWLTHPLLLKREAVNRSGLD